MGGLLGHVGGGGSTPSPLLHTPMLYAMIIMIIFDGYLSPRNIEVFFLQRFYYFFSATFFIILETETLKRCVLGEVGAIP